MFQYVSKSSIFWYETVIVKDAGRNIAAPCYYAAGWLCISFMVNANGNSQRKQINPIDG